RLSLDRGHGIRGHGGAGRRARPQRFPLELLHVGGHARRARRGRARLARLYGGTGPGQGPASRRTPAPAVVEPLLARARHRLGRRADPGLPHGSRMMDGSEHVFDDRTPGVEDHEPTASYLSYTVGVGLAILATVASFVVSQTDLLWAPGIPV